MENHLDFYYLVTYRVKPISRKRKRVLFSFVDDAIKCMKDKQTRHLHPKLTIYENYI